LCKAARVSIPSSDCRDASRGIALDALAEQLTIQGAVRIPAQFVSRSTAWKTALCLASRARSLTSESALALGVVGEFNLPPEDVDQRDFQALHIDFGLPRLSANAVAVALYTALYIDADQPSSGAATRIVPLSRLLQQRTWPVRSVITERLRDTSVDDSPVEGILARIVAAIDLTRDLPSKDDEGFLCGMEFTCIDDERSYFSRHGMTLAGLEQQVALGSGELLVFDNLATAHGRVGRRNARELHQLCIGLRSADLAQQAETAARVIGAFRTNDATAR
jgi:hypothetical protein